MLTHVKFTVNTNPQIFLISPILDMYSSICSDPVVPDVHLTLFYFIMLHLARINPNRWDLWGF